MRLTLSYYWKDNESGKIHTWCPLKLQILHSLAQECPHNQIVLSCGSFTSHSSGFTYKSHCDCANDKRNCHKPAAWDSDGLLWTLYPAHNYSSSFTPSAPLATATRICWSSTASSPVLRPEGLLVALPVFMFTWAKHPYIVLSKKRKILFSTSYFFLLSGVKVQSQLQIWFVLSLYYSMFDQPHKNIDLTSSPDM